MGKKTDIFKKERLSLNEIVLNYSEKNIKRFFSLDRQVYEDGALPKKTKELLGLVASIVLRCDDCIQYHLIECFSIGVTSDEISEAISISLIVGGSITIPHIRRAFETWDELVNNK
ncbi:MAG: carboxymuconolactone decarboxylase family protein [Candidatus Coatesbacteria bacterium]|nr:carboxymuconolactone decarboxylase family protein [Candidatus Coatesbacteria bacterium]